MAPDVCGVPPITVLSARKKEIMNFYAYRGTFPLGKAPLGTTGKMIFSLKTERGAKNRCRARFNNEPFTLYSYTSFYNDKTFTLVFRQD